MTFKEELTAERNEYWDNEVQAIISKIKELVKDYQQYDRCAKEYYNIKLMVKLQETNSNKYFLIFCMIDNKIVFIKNDTIYFLDEVTDTESPYDLFRAYSILEVVEVSRRVSSALGGVGFYVDYFCDKEFNLCINKEMEILNATIVLN